MRALCAGLFTAVAMINPAAAADDCKNPITQYDLNRCSGKDAEREDALLNKNYKELMGKVDAKEKAQIKNVQLAWIKFRDLQCTYEADRYQGGSMQPMVYSSCLYQMTKQRNKDLNDMINDPSH